MIKDVVLEDVIYNDYTDTVTFYFMTPKSILKEYGIPEVYDGMEAVHAEIRLEFPIDDRENLVVTGVMSSLSPTVEVSDNCFEDIDWTDVDLPREDLESLIRIAEEENWRSQANIKG